MTLVISKRLSAVLQYSKEVPISVKIKEHSGSVTIDLSLLKEGNAVDEIAITRGAKDANSFTIRGDKVSYFIGIQPTNDKGTWKREGRQEMAISKFLKILVPLLKVENLIGDRELIITRALEILGERVKETDNSLIRVSSHVGKIYKTATSQDESTGTLGGSCMRPESGSSGRVYVGNYDEIVKDLKIAYLTDKYGNLTSRALLWHDVETTKGEKINFMDRIYGTDSAIELMKKWAKQNDYWVKDQQSYCSSKLVKDRKQVTHFSKKLTLVVDKLNGLPYMDTLQELYKSKIHTSGHPDLDNRKCINLQSTSGNLNLRTCVYCGGVFHADNLHKNSEGYFCEECCIYSNFLNKHIRDYKTVVINDCSEYVPKDFNAEAHGLFFSEYFHCYYRLTDSQQHGKYGLVPSSKLTVPYGHTTSEFRSDCLQSRTFGMYILRSEAAKIVINDRIEYIPANYRDNKELLRQLKDYKAKNYHTGNLVR